MIAGDLENLKPRSDIQEVYTDAGYTGEVAARATEKHEVKQQVSVIKGRKRSENSISLEQFTITRDSEGTVTAIVCPNGVGSEVRSGKNRDRFVFRFTTSDLRVAAQRRQKAETGKEILNKRASVESTVRSVIQPFGGPLCKVPVRGRQRLMAVMVLSAAMVNIRRITAYLCPPLLTGLQNRRYALT